MSAIGRAVALTAVLLCATANCSADTLLTTDGRTFEGRLINQTSEKVVFEVVKYGIKGVVTLDPKEVASIKKQEPTQTVPAAAPGKEAAKEAAVPAAPSVNGPSYYLLPLQGEVGRHITSEFVSQAIADARKKHTRVLVLEIDSPGGSVNDVTAIVQTLAAVNDLRVVAVVRSAISAAAPIAMACRELYMYNSSTIGGAVVFRIGDSGLPEQVDEKMQSIWRAACRSAAELGGHSPLVAQGMTEASVELSILEQAGKKVVVEGTQGTPLKRKGKILTLTCQEAVACGLAQGEFSDYKSLGQLLNLADWHETGGAGRELMRLQVAKVKRLEKEYAEMAKLERLEIRSMLKLAAIQPDLVKIADDMKKIEAEGRAAERTKALLIDQYEREKAMAWSAYNADMASATVTRFADPVQQAQQAILQQAASSKRDARLAEIQQRMQPQALEIQNHINRCEEHYRAEGAKRTQLLMTLMNP